MLYSNIHGLKKLLQCLCENQSNRDVFHEKIVRGCEKSTARVSQEKVPQTSTIVGFFINCVNLEVLLAITKETVADHLQHEIQIPSEM